MIKSDDSICLKPCSGLIVTSYTRVETNNDIQDISAIFKTYNKYKRITQFPSRYKGEKTHYIYIRMIYLDYHWKNNLRVVRIFFGTSTFSRNTKEKSAKFVDMLSAIGGTMGLLTGFSIISGVEIVYFATKIFWNIIQEKTSYSSE